MEYARHIERICKIEDIEIGVSSRRGRAYRRSRRIEIVPVKGAISYAIALHEIGHILGHRQSGTRLDKETGAWEWAKANALEWNDTMERKLIKSLRWYLDKVARSKRMKRAAPSHPIFSFAPSVSLSD